MPKNMKKNPSFAHDASLPTYREEAIKAAKGLGYGQKVVKQIQKAETEGEIARIMRDARKQKFGLED